MSSPHHSRKHLLLKIYKWTPPISFECNLCHYRKLIMWLIHSRSHSERQVFVKKDVFSLIGHRHGTNYFQQYADVRVRAPLLVFQIKHPHLILPVSWSGFELTATVSSSYKVLRSASPSPSRGKKSPEVKTDAAKFDQAVISYTHYSVLNVIHPSFTNSQCR